MTACTSDSAFVTDYVHIINANIELNCCCYCCRCHHRHWPRRRQLAYYDSRMLCVILVLKLESSSSEQGPRYAVHCGQSLPEQSFKSMLFDKFVTLHEHGSTTLSFFVTVCSCCSVINNDNSNPVYNLHSVEKILNWGHGQSRNGQITSVIGHI